MHSEFRAVRPSGGLALPGTLLWVCNLTGRMQFQEAGSAFLVRFRSNATYTGNVTGLLNVELRSWDFMNVSSPGPFLTMWARVYPNSVYYPEDTISGMPVPKRR